MPEGVPSSPFRESLFPIVADGLLTPLETPVRGIFAERGVTRGG